MKWIKLFEQFGNNGSIQAINKLFLSFLLRRRLEAMNLKKIETRKFIYFYTISRSSHQQVQLSFNLEFVFSKETNLLHYPLQLAYDTSLLKLIPRGAYRLKGFWSHLTSIFEKLLKDYVSPYINVEIGEFDRVSWSQYETNFKKLKKP